MHALVGGARGRRVAWSASPTMRVSVRACRLALLVAVMSPRSVLGGEGFVVDQWTTDDGLPRSSRVPGGRSVKSTNPRSR